MRKVYLEDLDLSELDVITGVEHHESTIFHDNKTAYKIFNDLYDEERVSKQRKIELLGDGEILPITVMPKEQLVYGFLGDRFEGHTMDYINNAKTLNQLFIGMDNNYLLLYLLNIISKSIEEIHNDPRNIIISDLRAENIIIDEKCRPYIIDIESSKIDGIPNDTITLSLKRYLQKRNLYRGMKNVVTTKNTDRLCIIMMTLGILFRKHIDLISMYEYDEKAEQIEILKGMRNIILEIQKSSNIPEIPYIHEFMKDSISLSKKKFK